MAQESFDNYPIHITPLSPAHMGTGQAYDPTNYVIEEDALYTFDPHQVVRVIPESERNRLLATLSRKPDDRMLSEVQAFFHGNRERLIPVASQVIPVASGVTALHRARVGRTANAQADGRRVINALEIERTAYTPGNWAPVLPGSGIKGAMRTALLEDQRRAHHPRARWRSDNKSAKQMQQDLFGYEIRSLSKDPMRLIRIADAFCVSADATPTTSIRFAVNRARHEKKTGTATRAKDLKQLLECVQPGYRVFSGSIAIQLTDGVDSRHEGLPGVRWNLQQIAAACNAFYRPRLQQEIRDLNNRGLLNSDWRQMIGQLDDPGMQRKLDDNQAFLLRVGRHCGAESVTLDQVRSIRIMKGGRGKDSWEPSPRTWWLATDEEQDQRHLIPFGWLLVELDDAPDEALRDAIAHFVDDYSQWFDRVHRHQLELAGTLEQDIVRMEQQRQEREQAEKQDAERQARQAAMSPEELTIDELRTWFDEDKARNIKEPGGRLNDRLQRLKRESEAWSPEYKRLLAELAEPIFVYLKWGSKKKKADNKAWVEQLKKR